MRIGYCASCEIDDAKDRDMLSQTEMPVSLCIKKNAGNGSKFPNCLRLRRYDKKW